MLLQAVLAALGVVVAAAVAGYFTWRIAKRQNSGTTATSDAGALWVASSALRESLVDELVSTRAQLTDTSGQLAETSHQLTTSSVQVSSLLREIAASNAAVADAREETRLSREESAALRVLLTKVHDEVKTANALSIGKLVDNDETRRIALIPEKDRTDQEREHIDHVGIQTGEGPSRLKDEDEHD